MQAELTFLLTDVAGSTAIWERAPDEMTAALARHDAIIRSAVARLGGEHKQARGEGDSHFAVFPSPTAAVKCALDVQRALAQERWPEGARLSVRIGIHSGPAELRAGDYFGPTVNRAARLRSIAHGGQTVVSGAVAEAIGEPVEPDVVLRDRGHHRLKDLEEPMRVFELLHPDLRQDFPPLASLDGRRHNLPIQLTSFIGREDEIRMVAKLVAEESRLITLAGTGGIGKTRLSVQVAAEFVDSFPDGVWLVELANVIDPGRVAPEILTAVGVTSEGEAIDDLVAFLSARRVLIVLDNCEQVVAGAAEVVDAILRRCSDVVVLATSREPLGVSGEKVVRVAGMATPEDEQDRQSELYPAVRLFVDRAQVVDPAFVLNAGDAAAVVRICRRLDGLPLAIELAAARVRVLSPTQIDQRLQDRFALLTGGPRTRDARQRTIRAAIDWSHDLLSPEEAVLFRRLSVFVGGWTLDAAETVCASAPLDDSGGIDLLSGLVDKSLVVVDPRKDQTRYRMLESIRFYAIERLQAAGELNEMKDAHLDWIAALTGLRPASGEPADPAGAPVAVFREEADNIRAALDHAVQTDSQAGLALMWSTTEGWDSYSHSKEGLGRVRHLLENHPQRDASRLYGLSLLGILARKRGVLDVARASWEEAVEIARERNHAERLAANLTDLAVLAHYDGRLAEGDALLEEAEQIARNADDLSGLAHVLSGIGKLNMERDIGRSIAFLEEALRLRRDLREHPYVQELLENLTGLYERQGRNAEARSAAQEARELAAASDDQDSVITLALSLGRIAQDEGDFVEAEAMFQEVLTFAEENELPNEQAFAWALLGESRRALGDLKTAKDNYRRAMECAQRAGNVITAAFVSANLGNIALREGNLVEAWDRAATALSTAHEKDITSGVVDFLELWGEIDAATGDHRRALRVLGAAEALREQVGAARDRVDQPDYDAAVAAARSALGQGATAIWETGRREDARELTAELLRSRPPPNAPTELKGSREGQTLGQ